MVGSPVFDERHAAKIQETRFSRLSEEERHEAQSLMKLLGDPAYRLKDVPFARLGALFTKASACDPLTLDIEVLAYQYHVYQRVWADALELRREDALLELGKKIKCPVVAIHGDHDPHPSEGVARPLAAVVKDFRFILLDRCGHLPWIERYARDRFYAVLRAEWTP
jgi:pimeloyl-ACP methyl ester carboxylesterase